MSDDSLDEFLGWDIAENKTITAWSSKLSAKSRGKKTYSRRQGGSFASSQRRAVRESDQHIIANGFASTKDIEEEELEGNTPSIPPPFALKRANSVPIQDRKKATRLRRSNSISYASRDDTVKRAAFPRRSSLLSIRSFGSTSNSAENKNPNLSVLEEFVSPKRAKTVIDLPRKKVRSDNSSLNILDSFSNLAKFGEDTLSWAKTTISEASLKHSLPPGFNNSDAAENDYEQVDFSETSSTSTSAGSTRKRGIWDSPLDEIDDFSFSEAPSIRRSRFFSPAKTPGSVFKSNAGGKSTGGSLMSVASGDRPRKRNDEPETDDEVSTDDASIDSQLEAMTPMNDVSHYGNTSVIAFSPDLLDVRNAGPDDIMKSMSSYHDLRFLVKSLRKENANSRTSWHVAPPISWESERRAAFLHWATRSLGFSFRSGGMAITYLQISKDRGAGILELLEATIKSFKDQGFATETPATSKKPLFSFSSTKKAFGAPRILSLTPKGATTASLNQEFNATGNVIDNDLTSRMMALGMSDKKKSRCSDQLRSMSGVIFEDSDDMSFMESSRPSLENHTTARDLMAHMHGVTPIPRKGRPPRLSLEMIESTGASSRCIFNDVSPFLQGPSSTKSFAMPNDFAMTPMNKPDLGWGSCPVQGRDWGASDGCEPVVIDELMQRLDQSGVDAGILDDAEAPSCSQDSTSSTNLFDLELEAASQGSVGIEFDIPGHKFDSVLDNIARAKQNRRRQTSYAKHARMSLIASAVNPGGSILNSRKSLFDRPSNAFMGSEFALAEKLERTPEFAPCADSTSEDPLCSRRTTLADSRLLETIFSFLQETELLCKSSLVSTHWADASTQAHANMMLMSVGCSGDVNDFDTDSDDESVTEKANQSVGLMEREWDYLVSNFPWACFLSEGAFKRVYKVFNYNHRVEEAISIMDVNIIESTGNVGVVGAELAVSVLLSSLVRRGVCPNFVSTRGVFSCAYEPPVRSWGSASNKRPKGSFYVSPKAKRLPKEPAQSKRGRYQYIRMELCNEGDAEEYIKRQPDEAIDPLDAMKLLFQMAFSLHAAADRFSLKHYDVKLLNFFLQTAKTEKAGDVVMRYGLGAHTFALKSKCGQGIIAKLADYGTANIDSGSYGQPVTIAQFTTLENTPIDFLILGDAAQQGHGHDCFGLGLCMLHLYTGHAPYEEILEDVSCPKYLKQKLRSIWENETESQFSVIRSLILSEVYKDEEGHIIEGEPDEVLYDTLYRFLVLFGIPDLSAGLGNSKVWIAIKNTLENKTSNDKTKKPAGKKNQGNNCVQFNRDRTKYSLSRGNNKYIARARRSLESLQGGMDLLLSLVSFDPQTRASALDVLNSPFLTPLREVEGESRYNEDDEVLTYNAFSVKNS